jgi:hypothetical protein
MKPIAFAALALAACATAPMTNSDAPASLAAAETAFAAHSVREDMRVAFMANFADDGVFVRNGWVVSNDYLAKQAAPAIVLDWRPVYTEVARSGELGLSTGPWKITSKQKGAAPGQTKDRRRLRPVRLHLAPRGAGPWRVEVDLGIAHPQSALWDAKLATVTVPGGAPASSLAAAEQRFAADAKSAGTRAAYERNGAGDLRFYRTGAAPVIGQVGRDGLPDDDERRAGVDDRAPGDRAFRGLRLRARKLRRGERSRETARMVPARLARRRRRTGA